MLSPAHLTPTTMTCSVTSVLLPHSDVRFELQKVVFTTSACLNTSSCCHVMGWFVLTSTDRFCVKKKVVKLLKKNKKTVWVWTLTFCSVCVQVPDLMIKLWGQNMMRTMNCHINQSNFRCCWHCCLIFLTLVLSLLKSSFLFVAVNFYPWWILVNEWTTVVWNQPPSNTFWMKCQDHRLYIEPIFIAV